MYSEEEERIYLLLIKEEQESSSSVGDMEGHRDDVVSNRPRKVYSDDQLAIEIPETAHQISSGQFISLNSSIQITILSISVFSQNEFQHEFRFEIIQLFYMNFAIPEIQS